jgi:2-oxo-4-hydroxy-4-carboxy-5-ureidoimidazoline decarboxylase
MTLEQLNALPAEQARETFAACCGCSAWIERMAVARPFASAESVLTNAERAWWALSPQHWREAFTHHPKIGDLESVKKRFAATAAMTSREQSGAMAASAATLAALTEANRAYEERFGYIFIVFASGKSADEMLAILRSRLDNAPEAELHIAAAEQAKITRLRLERLLGGNA